AQGARSLLRLLRGDLHHRRRLRTPARWLDRPPPALVGHLLDQHPNGTRGVGHRHVATAPPAPLRAAASLGHLRRRAARDFQRRIHAGIEPGRRTLCMDVGADSRVALALIVGALFVLRLLTAPEPLIPISTLQNRIVRCAIAANAFGWGSIIGLNVFLPMYLQGVMGRSASQAGLSLVVLMVALNTSAGLAGQVLGLVRHYKVLPVIALLLSTVAIAVLAWQASSMTPLSFECTLIAIGVGFGPLPSLTAVALQNVVPRHQLGISIGTMNFSTTLFATMRSAVFGAIVLAGPPAGQSLGSAFGAANPAEAFSRLFLVAAASMAIALVAIVVMEQKPLQTAAEL